MSSWDWQAKPYRNLHKETHHGKILMVHQYQNGHLYGVIRTPTVKHGMKTNDFEYFGGPSKQDDLFPQSIAEAVNFLRMKVGGVPWVYVQ